MTEPRGRGSRAPGRTGRRRHAAAAGRVLAAGLSAGTAILLVGTLGGTGSANPNGAADRPPVAILLPQGDDGAVSSGQDAPMVTRTEAPPITTSQAS
jgi:hypothetical protein